MTKKNEFILTKEDVANSGWEKVVESLEKKDSHSYSSPFYSKINEVEDAKHKEIFLILATLMSGRLNLRADSQLVYGISTTFEPALRVLFGNQ